MSVVDMAQAGARNDEWHARAVPGRLYRSCANATHGACNWLIPNDDSAEFCAACRHNRTIPSLTDDAKLRDWRKLERAKRHLFYGLLRLGLPLANRTDEPQSGLAFDFLAATDTPHEQVMTGHDNGIITISLAEADDGHREQLRQQMGEPYRTLLGHFRHEVGHYFWDVLVDRGGKLDRFRERFGDERQDYDTALQTYYGGGPAADWPEHFVSAYASCHPWEDFAETWAHYLHIVDTLEMAGAFGMRLRSPDELGAKLTVAVDAQSADVDGIDALIAAWVPVTVAVNSLNRCMGQPDLYPFVLTAAVIAKLGFVHDLVRNRTHTFDETEPSALKTSIALSA
jgi:hypothetical protein